MLLPYRLPNFDKGTKQLLDPHVVILGAGASKAACPVDKNGVSVPLLKNIHKMIFPDIDFSSMGFSPDDLEDFEAIYSRLHSTGEYPDLLKKLEKGIFEFFSKLELPEDPTLYDYLVLSLTSKDLIISFNWDPFLLQAYRRNLSDGNLPQLSFVHGNVGMGLCYDCRSKGYYGYYCRNCMKKFEPMPLLFPVENKDYKGGIIKNEWDLAITYLEQAAGLTIFGYGAPKSDAAAVELLRVAFGESNVRYISPVTVINLESQREHQLKEWGNFCDSRMLHYVNRFNETDLWRNPRVSLEHLFDAILQQHPRETEQSFVEFETLADLQAFAKSIDSFAMYI